MSNVENDQNANKERLRPYAGCSGTHLRKISRHFFIGMRTGSFANRSPCKNREGGCVFTPAAFSGYITDLIKANKQIRLLHLLHAREVAGGEAIDIQAAGEIPRVKGHAMRAGGEVSVDQRCH